MKAGKKSGSNLPPKAAGASPAALAIAIPYPRGLSWRVAEEAPAIPHFTLREKEIGGWVAEGLSDAEISGRLPLGLHGVKAHVSSLLHKTGTQARTQFIAWVWRNRFAAEFHQSARRPVKYS